MDNLFSLYNDKAQYLLRLPKEMAGEVTDRGRKTNRYFRPEPVEK